MSAEALLPPPSVNRRRRVVIAVAALLVAALVVGYYLFLHPDFVVLYSDLKPADASAIVAELDAKGIEHRLRDQGTTILVPAGDSDTVRLAVAGSDIPMKGSVGFELFNKSDMGLTDFAQKINYQRALQGELARTIMMMDGIETARVHLAIPERSLFRGNRSTPKAAIEVLTLPGRQLDGARVAGIQRLVAQAVPDLPLGEVVVLDGDGRVVSTAAPAGAATPELEEQAAAQSYYSARAKAALAAQLPGLQADVKTLMLVTGDAATTGDGAEATAFGTTAEGGRNFALRVTIVTTAPLNTEDQAVARSAVVIAVGFDQGRGDTISFEQGPVGVTVAPIGVPVQSAPSPPPVAQKAPTPVAGDWWAIALGLLAVAVVASLVLRRRPALSLAERDLFVDRIRQRLGTGDARA